MWPNPQETADSVTFTGNILNGKLGFFSSGHFSLLSNRIMILIGSCLHKDVVRDLIILNGVKY